ncbi:MAG: PIN domain-containing protein [Patescibacteria group bacterium]|mgnify:CR=1 FL=1
MANRVFFDSSVFIGFLNKDDALHVPARTLVQAFLDANDYTSVTSNFVISETITVLSQRANKQLAIMFAELIYHSPAIHIITVDQRIEAKAVEYLKKLKSKNVSFCDCTILAIMDLFQIPYLATFDNDFKKGTSSQFKILK